ncbi:class I SAM-dependent methyltransferase [Pelomyxa schiedti]|nr:class I SAM-dependent methyltransferase [Pelomyxa schiedti]
MSQRGWDWSQVTPEEALVWTIPDGGVVTAFQYLKVALGLGTTANSETYSRLRVLDLGCGLGRHTCHFALQGCQVWAMDIMEQAVSATTNLLQTRTGTVSATEAENLRLATGRVSCGRMTELPYGDAFFDLVICFNVVYHARRLEIEKALSEILRVTKPGGFVFITFLSKLDWNKPFSDPVIEPNTIVKQTGPEAGVPHFFSTRQDIDQLMTGFRLVYVEYREDLLTLQGQPDHGSHYRVLARKP